MSIKYMTTKPNGERTGPVAFQKAKDNVRDQARTFALNRGRKMRLGVRGKGELGNWRIELDETMDQWEKLVKTHPPGTSSGWTSRTTRTQSGTRIVDVSPPTKQTEGNDDIDKIYSWLTTEKNGRNGGICNRRFISGTTTWTQHCPWPDPNGGSNALDWFAQPDTMDELYEQAYDLARSQAPHRSHPRRVQGVGTRGLAPIGGGLPPAHPRRGTAQARRITARKLLSVGRSRRTADLRGTHLPGAVVPGRWPGW